MIRFTIFFLILSFNLLAQNGNILIPKEIKTQKQLAIWQAKKYPMRFPIEVYECLKHWMRLDDYHIFLRKKQEEFSRNQQDLFKKVFEINEHRRIPTTDNQFAFSNADVTPLCDNNFRYCHSYTFIQTAFNRLAHYDPDNFFGFSVPDKTNYPEEWFDFYRKLIDDLVLKRKPIIIPYFKNLYEFSDSDPKIINYLKERIAIKWAERNVNFFGARIFKSVKETFSKQESLELYKSLTYQINELHYNPILWLARPVEGPLFQALNNGNIWIHVMQAYKVSELAEDGSYVIYFWDIYSPQDADKAVNTVKIDPNSDKFHNAYSEIEQVHGDRITVGKDIKNLTKFYEENPKYYDFFYSQYLERLSNPPSKYYPPYKGPALPPLILEDGSHWYWPQAWINPEGLIVIPGNEKNNLPKEVKKVLVKFLGKKWASNKIFDPKDFQSL